MLLLLLIFKENGGDNGEGRVSSSDLYISLLSLSLIIRLLFIYKLLLLIL